MFRKKGNEQPFFHFGLHNKLNPGDLIKMADGSILEVIAEMPARAGQLSKQPIGVRIIKRGKMLRAYHNDAVLHTLPGIKFNDAGGTHESVIVTVKPLKIGGQKRIELPITSIIQGEQLRVARRKLPVLARLISKHTKIMQPLTGEEKRTRARERTIRDFERRHGRF